MTFFSPLDPLLVLMMALVHVLLLLRFAEGDSRILQQKLTRDRLKRLQSDGMVSALLAALNPVSPDGSEARAALALARKLAAAGRDRQAMAAAMNTHWRDIYDLANLVAARHMRNQTPATFPEPIVERIKPHSSAMVFDHM